jgi:hypothetical protein
MVVHGTRRRGQVLLASSFLFLLAKKTGTEAGATQTQIDKSLSAQRAEPETFQPVILIFHSASLNSISSS